MTGKKKSKTYLIIGILLLASSFSADSFSLWLFMFALGVFLVVLHFSRKKKAGEKEPAKEENTKQQNRTNYTIKISTDDVDEDKSKLFFYRNKLNTKKAISSFDTYIVLDCETTGLSRSSDKIIEISMIKFKKGEEVDRLKSFINPLFSVPAHITKLTGITNDDLKDAPKIEDVVPQMWDFMQGYTLVGYNIPFDIGFIKREFDNFGYEGSFEYVDVLQLARKAYPNMENHKLETLIRALDLAEAQSHRAEDDVICTQKLLVMCVDILLGQKEKELSAKRKEREIAR